MRTTAFYSYPEVIVSLNSIALASEEFFAKLRAVDLLATEKYIARPIDTAITKIKRTTDALRSLFKVCLFNESVTTINFLSSIS